ncbi:hypothetical protein IJG11_00340 [Candidatus Saccharibacteria bacterium]|nr:hypothetical protein [Candidatus Saccharibacteria bacterium]
MDPSNFGSFSSGGNFGGAGATGTQNGGVASGTDTIASPQQSAPVQAQGFVGVQVAQPQMVAQPQAPGSMQFQPQVVSSSTEDVVLGGAGPKKSRRGVVVGVVIAGLVLIGLGVGAILSFNGDIMMSGLATNSFEDFVGYMMSGGNANSDVADFDAESAYAVDNFYYRSGTEEGKEYFRQLNQRWENFVKNSKENENEEDLIAKIGDGVKVMDIYAEKGIIPGEEVLRRYISGGEDGARTYFLEYFASDDAVSDMEMQYLVYQDDYLDDVLDMIRIYGENGCIIDDGVNEACIEEKGLYNSGEYQQMMRAAQVLRDYVMEIKNQTKVVCGELIKMRAGGNE